ncbi:hypothetical protein TNCV_5039551 [Trichonephila clavipes]|nr:hypothetical protein TNCV_5039551 [Trichonephila clavipes]
MTYWSFSQACGRDVKSWSPSNTKDTQYRGANARSICYDQCPFVGMVYSGEAAEWRSWFVAGLQHPRSVKVEIPILSSIREKKVFGRGGCQFRCRPRHLTEVQNYEILRH